jgi:hypothetical protein
MTDWARNRGEKTRWDRHAGVGNDMKNLPILESTPLGVVMLWP